VEILNILIKQIIMKTISIILIALSFASCKTTIATNYKISTKDRNYYCNDYSIVNDTIFGSENRYRTFSIPVGNILEIKNK